ncbi:hypothetical protein L873DRAFT_1291013 [Choiromyces venosus 120613-1]|uniref:Uncharacterized protein n=1 Tax=Choiromyces venosus 120613-1 TaxID=1336337 RepID=A0A3N4JGK9_9PEZI|nr:hypothetical protein L873DRAFT_1291013 [Choiromyces venosus 120613-1]
MLFCPAWSRETSFKMPMIVQRTNLIQPTKALSRVPYITPPLFSPPSLPSLPSLLPPPSISSQHRFPSNNHSFHQCIHLPSNNHSFHQYIHLPSTHPPPIRKDTNCPQTKHSLVSSQSNSMTFIYLQLIILRTAVSIHGSSPTARHRPPDLSDFGSGIYRIQLLFLRISFAFR